MLLENSYVLTKDYMIYKMPMELDHHSVGQISCQIDSMIEGGQVRHLIMDFSETEFMDSSGIGVIIGRFRKMKFFDGKITAMNMSARVEKLFRTAGLHKIVEVKDGE